MSARRTIGGVLVLGAAIGGCQLAFPFDGYGGSSTSGEPDAAEADAPTGLDASSIDAGPTEDAGGFCERIRPTPLFCADFDEGSLIYGWQSLVKKDGSTIALDLDASTSGPGSLEVSLPDGNGSADVYLTFNPEIAARKAHVDFDVRVDRFDPSSNPNAAICVLAVDFAGGYELRLVTGPLRSYLEEQTTFADGGITDGPSYVLSHPISVSTWNHVRIDVVLAPTPSVMVTVGGVVQASGVLGGDWQPGAITAIAAGGIFAVNTVAAWTTHIDNVVLANE